MRCRRARFALFVGALLSIAFVHDAFAAPTKVTVYDDGIKLRGERDRPLPPTPYPREIVELFALPGETVALQIVIDAAEELDDVHAEIAAADGGALPLSITSYAERFVRVERPSGNVREPGSLAFTAQAAPDPEPFVGYLADALVPKPLHVEQGGRGVLWVDLFVPDAAPAGLYEAMLMIASQRGMVASPEFDSRSARARSPTRARGSRCSTTRSRSTAAWEVAKPRSRSVTFSTRIT